jgi:hypothetical protein
MAYELDAAFGYADFSGLAQTILRYVRAQVFGKRKSRAAHLPKAELIERTGRKRQNIDRAFRELLDSGALLEVVGKPDDYRFVKDYETWTSRERHRDFSSPKIPRLTPEEVADCKAAPDYATRFLAPKKAAPKAEELNPNGFKNESERIHPDQSSGIRTDAELNPNGFKNESERIQAHIEEPRPAGRHGDGETDKNSAGELSELTPAQTKLSARIAAFIVEKTDDGENLEHYDAEARLWIAAGHKPDRIKAAILETLRRGIFGLGLTRYVASILANPSPKAEARASPAVHKPSPPVAYHRAGDFDKEPRAKPQPLPTIAPKVSGS